jgi:hypothetical protein
MKGCYGKAFTHEYFRHILTLAYRDDTELTIFSILFTKRARGSEGILQQTEHT